MADNTSLKDQIRQAAEADLEKFIALVAPKRVLGHIHSNLISWWTKDDAKKYQLVLLPRDHQKSALIAYRVAWEITKNPAIRVLFISSTANLAVKQLKFIKDILTSDIYRSYWPDMINRDEGKREKWTETEISVDHPTRKVEFIRDPTIFTAGLTTSIVGLHCDIAVLDDVVTDDNSATEDGRTKVKQQASYLASIGGVDSQQWVVGTRYHPKDLYGDMVATTVAIFDDDGHQIDTQHLYEVFEEQVESQGDGTGTFLWPRKLVNGKWYGFDQRVLAEKRALYYDKTKFRAQYYNDPNDLSEAAIGKDKFQYYNRASLHREDGRWYYKGSRLNLTAAVDFAYSTREGADYTCIVVVGCDAKHNYYILDIDRFRTQKISEYFEKILRLHVKWDFRKLRAEITAAQSVIVRDLKDNYIRVHGLALSIDEQRPTKDKNSRIEGILQPKYSNLQMWHYQGGDCELLEEELVLQNPTHDDIKDALASAVEVCTPPSFMSLGGSLEFNPTASYYNPRFGGIG
jgi:hypothetical protein